MARKARARLVTGSRPKPSSASVFLRISEQAARRPSIPSPAIPQISKSRVPLTTTQLASVFRPDLVVVSAPPEKKIRRLRDIRPPLPSPPRLTPRAIVKLPKASIRPIPQVRTTDRLARPAKSNLNFSNRLKNIETGEQEKSKSNMLVLFIVATVIVFLSANQ